MNENRVLSNCCKAHVMETAKEEDTPFYYRCTQCGKPGSTHRTGLSMIKDNEVKVEPKKRGKT